MPFSLKIYLAKYIDYLPLYTLGHKSLLAEFFFHSLKQALFISKANGVASSQRLLAIKRS